MNKLLVVIDYQNDFVTGSLGFEEAKKIEGFIETKIVEFENNHDDVVFTKDTHDHDYLHTIEGEKLPIKHCMKGTQGHEIYGKISTYACRHLCFFKDTFGSTELMNYISQREIEEIHFVGVVTNICVISNVILAKACKPNTKIVVYKSGCASNNLSLEREAYDIMQNLHIEIIA